ncbi:hypothetical protein J3E64_002460 [Sphingobium sp. OAS761]|uniref:DUF2846 domain-containing protein n=1 Tax=Sphingobium sp. OAS761 TaxID=2817901 RepID=UPI00209D9AC0|nr:DUF2846 domain-containing protein [Sphingobium sp. OAS761]MCP1470767.1 hypothetical protein [Sphingobium sp. OAS761]
MKRLWVAVLACAAFPATLLAQDTVPAPSADTVVEQAPPADSALTEVPATVQPVVDDIMPPPEGKGQIIFFRKGGFVGSAISCAVHENGAKVSSLPPGRYFVHVAEPGIHEYSVKSEATDTLRMEIEPGETYYAKCAIAMGIMAGRPNLSPADKQTYFGMSKKLKLVENKPE